MEAKYKGFTVSADIYKAVMWQPVLTFKIEIHPE